jgi:hypothetical protein
VTTVIDGEAMWSWPWQITNEVAGDRLEAGGRPGHA